jgi:NADH-quinone oxidoreductase subunit L
MMDLLFSLFPNPQSSFGLLALILGLPALGALINGLFGKRLGPGAVRLMALVAVFGSFAFAVVAFLMLRHASEQGAQVRLSWTAWRWMTLDTTPIDVSFSFDALSGLMTLIVTGVGALIHGYATGYMKGDPGFHRFFAYMNLFIFAMLVLVLGDSLPILFIGWEGVGLCSYLLIGFWFEEQRNAAAGKKAFIANRIGDAGLLVAMAMIAHQAGTLSWSGMESQAGALLARVQVWPIGSVAWGHPIWVSAATLVGLALLLGCVGKSAQIPLYVWLPDAMAGPTPVSALIHAATMVTAGVYLVARLNFLFVLSPLVMMVVATVGALTALLAASIALLQNDIKKVLAYSTVSQLGYMFMAVGVGAFAAGIFHLMTHAFFKAALFLCAGCVIHAMRARVHDTDASQDMRNMGGLRKHMPRTYYSYLAAALAIAGMPLTSGFFSKDDILISTWVNRVHASAALKDATLRALDRGADAPQRAAALAGLEAPEWFSVALFSVGLLVAVLTAFYMFRSVVMTFFGDFKGWIVAPAPRAAAAQQEQHTGRSDSESGEQSIQGPEPHEAPASMTVPVMILAGLALVAGFINTDQLRLSRHVSRWLEPSLRGAAQVVEPAVSAQSLHAIEWRLLSLGGLAFVIGCGAAWWVYQTKRGAPARAAARALPRLYRWGQDKWRVDELYDATVIGLVDALAETAARFDRWVVDGIICKLTALVIAAAGSLLRLVQNGKVQMYAAVMAAGVAAMGLFVAVPHADVVVSIDEKTGNYMLHAAPGLGYQYRWDLDGDGKWDGGAHWTLRAAADLRGPQAPEPGESKKIRVEVRNWLGLTSLRELTLAREKIDGSVPERRPLSAVQGVSP